MQLKANIGLLEDMRRHEAGLVAAEKSFQDELIATVHRRTKSREERESNILNTEMVLVVKQGQVEIEESPVVTDMSAALMLTRSIVEDLNKIIIGLGADRVTQLKETVQLRKGINALKWTQQKLQIELEEYMDRTTEFNLLRVTRDMQELIKVGGFEAKQAAEVEKLEKKLEKMRELTDERIADRKYKWSKLIKKNSELQEENRRLEATVTELSSSVAERENISKIRRMCCESSSRLWAEKRVVENEGRLRDGRVRCGFLVV